VTADPHFRSGRASDAADLAALIDCASRGLLNWYWATLCEPGESALEKGRSRIRRIADSPAHYAKWTVAEVDGENAGGFTGYRIPEPFEMAGGDDLPEVYTPMLELEQQAAGSWFLMALAVFVEFRGRGIGTALLREAEGHARTAHLSAVSILVESANLGAERLYRRSGYQEMARPPYIPVPGSRDDGDWILLTKEVPR
jgi:ribosomal protein S18 acetylase RimI-like enzyme